MRDAYEVLGIAVGCTYDDARDVYLRRVRLLHPDRLAADPDLAHEASRLLAETTQAWATVRATLSKPTDASSARPANDARSRGGSEPADGGSTHGANGGTTYDHDGGAGAAYGDDGTATAAESELVDWVVGALVEAARRDRVSIDAADILLLIGPVDEALRSRRFRRRRGMHSRLLRSAMDADLGRFDTWWSPSRRAVPAPWRDVYERSEEVGVDAAVLLLLDPMFD